MLMDEINILRKEVKEVPALKKRIAVLEEKLAAEYNPKRTDETSKKCKICEESFSSQSFLKKHLVENHPSRIKCKKCETTFERNSDLEVHITNNHEGTDQHSCDICGKTFVLKWRLKKHTDGHNNKSQKYCHYYNNDKSCPYEEIGCKFQHQISEKCVFGQKCKNKLCQFKHEVLIENHEKVIDVLENEVIEEFEKDEQNILSLKEKTGLDLTILVDVKSCKKCGFETHSEGKLRKHERLTHQVMDSNKNIIMGFKNDIQEYFNILKDMGIDINKIDCQICEFKTNSHGELKMHEQQMH